MTKALISYDDTLNDHDALAFGRVLGGAGVALVLAYVRHTTQAQRSREELEEHEAQALLERGARWLDDLDVERRVVVSASTGQGLRWLAEHEAATSSSSVRTTARPRAASPPSTQLRLCWRVAPPPWPSHRPTSAPTARRGSSGSASSQEPATTPR